MTNNRKVSLFFEDRATNVVTNLSMYWPYVSDIVIRNSIELSHTNSPIVPKMIEFNALVVFADISGFSTLAETLAHKENSLAVAAEKLSDYMEKSLDIIIEKIYSKNGDVIKFAGDACLSVFPETVYQNQEECIAVGVETALSLVEELHVDNIVLHVHSGVGYGKIRGYNVGGVDGQWEFFISGEPLEQVSSAEHEAQLGELIVSPQVYSLLNPKYIKSYLIKESGNVLIKQMNSTSYNSIDRRTRINRMIENNDTFLLKQYLFKYISPTCVKGMLNGYTWGNELRNITTLFINLKGMKFLESDSLEYVQKVVTTVQSSLQLVDGVLCRFSVDDKGTVILCAFGLSFYQHENDPYRAIIFSLDLRKKMMIYGLECWIGISYGPAFCGTVGGPTRCEYTVHGTNVNLAARCMVASRGIGILVEENVYNQVKKQFNWDKPRLQKLKGYERLMPLYGVKGMKIHFNFYMEDSQVIGRLKEKQQIETIISKIITNQRRIIYLEGEAGFGKTYLLTYLSNKIREINEEESDVEIAWLNTNGNDMSTHKMYYFWIGIFSCIFQLDNLENNDDQISMINSIVPEELKNYIYIFKQLYPELNIKELIQDNSNNNSDNMTIDKLLFGTLSNTINLLTNKSIIVNEYIEQLISSVVIRTRELEDKKKSITKVLLVFEDIQLSDSSSIELIIKCINELSNVNFLITGRSNFDKKILNDYITDNIVLEKFSKTETIDYLRNFFNNNTIDNQLVDLIYNKSSGNPLYISELTDVLVKQNHITNTKNGVKLNKHFDGIELPDGLQSLVISHLDEMPSLPQLLIRISSALGTSFQSDQIINVAMQLNYDSKQTDSTYIFELTKALNYLENRKILKLFGSTYSFCQNTFREAIYPEIAMHYLKANNIEFAYNYFKRAAQEAQRSHCYNQALSLYQYALDNSEAIHASKYEIANLHYLMGIIHYSQDNVVSASDKFKLVLQILNYPLPHESSLKLIIDNYKLSHNLFKIHENEINYIKQHETEMNFINPLLLISSAYEKLINYFYDASFLQGRNVMLCSLTLSKRHHVSSEYACSLIRLAQFLSMNCKNKEKSLRLIDEASEILNHTNNFEAKIYVQYYTSLIQLTFGLLSKSFENINKLYWLADFSKSSKMMKDAIVLKSIILFLRDETEAGLNDLKPYINDLYGGGFLMYTLFKCFHGDYSNILVLCEKYGIHQDLSNVVIMKDILQSSKSIPIGILISIYNLIVVKKYNTSFTILKLLLRQRQKIKQGYDIIDFLYLIILAYVWWKCAIDCFLDDEFYRCECIEIGKIVLKLLNNYGNTFYVCKPLYYIWSCIYHRLFGLNDKAKFYLNKYIEFPFKIPILEVLYYCESYLLKVTDNPNECQQRIYDSYKKIRVVQLLDYISKVINK